jgi:hypothetical protein
VTALVYSVGGVPYTSVSLVQEGNGSLTGGLPLVVEGDGTLRVVVGGDPGFALVTPQGPRDVLDARLSYLANGAAVDLREQPVSVVLRASKLLASVCFQGGASGVTVADTDSTVHEFQYCLTGHQLDHLALG